MRLVSKAKAIALAALRQQGRVSEARAIEHAAEIARFGFSTADRQKLTSNLALLDSVAAAQVEKRAKSKANREAEAKALADAKRFKRRLDAAVADLYARDRYEDGFSMPVAAEVFRAGSIGELRSSTPKVLGYLARVRPHVEQVKSLLAPYFDGGDAVALLDAAASALKKADTSQELALLALPQETLDVYQLKGEVLFLIERLNRAGRAAFDGDKGLAAQFNKDLLRRGRRRRGEAVDDGAPPDVVS